MLNRPSPLAQTQPSWRPRLIALASYGGLALLLAGVPTWLLDRWAGWELTRAWAQICATLAGGLLAALALCLRSQHLARRALWLASGSLLLLAVLDSLDGQQDLLHFDVVMWFGYALALIGFVLQIGRAECPRNARWWLAVLLGSAAALVYLGAAGYYIWLNAIGAQPQIAGHWLNRLSTLALLLLSWIGGLGVWAPELRGPVSICPSCGLPNIPERQTCKRCRAALGPAESAR